MSTRVDPAPEGVIIRLDDQANGCQDRLQRDERSLPVDAPPPYWWRQASARRPGSTTAGVTGATMAP